MDADEKRTLRERIVWELQERDLPEGDRSGAESERIADAVLNALDLEQVGWQNTKYPDLWLAYDPYIERQHPVGKGYEAVYRLAASGQVTEGKGTQ